MPRLQYPSSPRSSAAPFKPQACRPIRLSGACVLLLCVVAALAGESRAQSFAPPAQYATASNPQWLTVGDFNGDTRADIATLAAGNISVLLSNADGSFGARIDYPTSTLPQVITSGHFDADGKLDLATGNHSLQTGLTVLRGNGDGTFVSAGNYPAGFDVRSITTGDFNNDGRVDLALASHGGAAVSVLLALGDGNFGPARFYSVGVWTDSLAVGDINNDGRLDLGTTHRRNDDSNASYLLGNGDGTFQPAKFLDLGPGAPSNLKFFDVSGDGNLDLLATDGNLMSVYLGKGDASFHPPLTNVVSTTPASSLSLAVDDLDNDGKYDVIVSAQLTLCILPGRGDGTFRNSIHLTGPSFFTEAATGDFNADGKADIAGTNSSAGKVTVFLNQTGPRVVSGVVTDEGGAPLGSVSVSLISGGATPSSTLTAADGSYSFTGLASGAGYTVTPTHAHYGFAPASRTFDNLTSDATANFTGTRLRFNITGFVIGSQGARLRGVAVNLSGDASAATTTAADGSFSFNSLPAGGNYTVTPSLPRFTFAPASRTFNNLTADRAGTFVAALQTFTISGAVRDVSKGRAVEGVTVTLSGSKAATTQTRSLDGKYSFTGLTIGGDYTVTVSPNASGALFTSYRLAPPLSREFKNLSSDATADFAAAVSLSDVDSPRDIIAADFNKDGRLDVAVSGFNLKVLLGNGDGTFAPAAVYGVGTIPARIAVGDLNGDGNADVAMSSFSDDDIVSVLLGNGDGTFRPHTNYPVGSETSSLTLADFNGDGRPDIAAARYSTPFVSVLLNKGDGTFHGATALAVGAQVAAVSHGDFNGDGRVDLAVTSNALSNSISVLLGLGDGTFGGPIVTGAPAPSFSLTVGDFNKDGRADLAAVNSGGGVGGVSVYVGNGNGTFQSPVNYGSPGDPREIIEGDFDGDGQLDLSMVLYSSATARTLLGRGDGTFKSPIDNRIGSTPEGIAAGDFDGDGRLDLATTGYRCCNPGEITVLLNASSDPTVKFGAASYNVGEGAGSVSVSVTRSGDISRAASVEYSTSDGTAGDRSDYTIALGTLRFAPGEATKSLTIFVTDDSLVEGQESFSVGLGSPVGAALGGPSVAVVNVTSDDAAAPPPPNAADAPQFFAAQHYRDFLNRDPDAPGLAFWTNQIAECGADAGCVEVRRINVSAAFFLSPEFQETGFFVIRAHRAASSGRSADAAARIRHRQFVSDARQVGEGLVDGQPDFVQKLAANKRTYAEQVVGGAEFAARFPVTQAGAEYVDALYASAGVAPAAAERQEAIDAFGAGGAPGRAAALVKVADSSAVRVAEFRAAFVLMQYFGYLRRNPTDLPDIDDSGYQFWLGKLGEFGGDYIAAEMVKAFITSGEYRARFGQ